MLVSALPVSLFRPFTCASRPALSCVRAVSEDPDAGIVTVLGVPGVGVAAGGTLSDVTKGAGAAATAVVLEPELLIYNHPHAPSAATITKPTIILIDIYLILNLVRVSAHYTRRDPLAHQYVVAVRSQAAEVRIDAGIDGCSHRLHRLIGKPNRRDGREKKDYHRIRAYHTELWVGRFVISPCRPL